MTGQTISHYRILAKLGEGGMGVVYKAEDTKLRRTVALKFLPPHALENRERFLREAQAAAALNHPNICTVYEIDEEHGFLAMELIDGVSVKDKIAARPLPLEEALDIAMQTCAGLAAAHEKGIVHRDIKPANLMLTAQGQLKIMDFGLAQVGDRTRITKTGSSLGTPAYMSPEQAKGDAVDRRTDVWSLGVVLYEMLAGRLPFRGDSEQAVSYGIVHSQPEPLSALRTGLPLDLDRIASKALSKDADTRYQHIEDLLVDLRRVTPSRHSPDRPPKANRLLRFLLAAAAAAAVFAAAWMLASRYQQTPAAPPISSVIPIPPSHQLVPSWPVPFDLSADGRNLVYAATEGGRRRLFLRPMDQFDPKPLPGTEDARSPFFSPDGRWVGFFAGSKLFKVAIGGGSPVLMAELKSGGNGACWAEDGSIIYGSSHNSMTGLMRLAQGESQPVPFTTLGNGETSHGMPRTIPGTPLILFTSIRPTFRRQVGIASLQGGTYRILVDGQQADYLPDGQIVYATDDALRMARLDLAGLQISRGPVTLLDDVYTSLGQSQTFFRVSSSGTLVYVTGRNEHSLVKVNRAGHATALTARRAGYRLPRASHDGRFIAVAVDPPDEGDSAIEVLDLERDSFSTMTRSGHNLEPVFTPDGKRIAWLRLSGGNETNVAPPSRIYWKATGGLGEPERMTASEGEEVPRAFSPDGKHLLFARHPPGSPWGLWLMPLHPPTAPVHLVTTGEASNARLSPDGRWLAYTSTESNRSEVYVRPFPASNQQWNVSTNGGTAPVWSRDGKEIFYLEGRRMMAVRVQAGAGFSAARPEFLFDRPELTMGNPSFDVLDDGLLMVQRDPLSLLTEFRVVHNWVRQEKPQ